MRSVRCEVGVGWVRIGVDKCDVSGCTYECTSKCM